MPAVFPEDHMVNLKATPCPGQKFLFGRVIQFWHLKYLIVESCFKMDNLMNADELEGGMLFIVSLWISICSNMSRDIYGLY